MDPPSLDLSIPHVAFGFVAPSHHTHIHPTYIMAATAQYDVVIVGAGFAGIFLLYHLRKLGLSCRIYEAGDDLGGTWQMNVYPGARVDSENWLYQFSMPEVWEDWSWSEKYPAGEEILRYFAHVEKKLKIKKDVDFHTRVVGAQFDRGMGRWRIETEDGRATESQFFVACTGFAAKRYTPDFPGLDSFKGPVYHSSCWPQEGVSVTGKKVAVIGTGATGVQIIQEWAKQADSLTVFQRTPNLALPMRQARCVEEELKLAKALYPHVFRDRERTFGGYTPDLIPRRTSDATLEEREAILEAHWTEGGFIFILGGFMDVLTDEQANREVYDFWAKKTRARIHDPRKRDILAPLDPPHAIGAKRCSLEQDYFDVFNRPNVDVVNLREDHIVEFKPHGITMSSGAFHELDGVAFATGYDAVTGGLTNMGLGLAISGYPNMFHVYGVHGPTGLSNGPTSIEMQGRWIVDAIKRIRASGLSYVEATPEAAEGWTKRADEMAGATLLVQADSWYMGANIPGKKRRMLNFVGGLPLYERVCTEALSKWDGFRTVPLAN
ncbi:FAD/NAD(P)-binding domain-containing protein [Aspergillus heteromorphus CBS 117.55]|uniref:FAD/NAD(P)-binding domain-containing protein n=1 Tax=Aspergillus heteromorphus CBS 117.55 TaxID=1448321 RepID=A0A317VUE4_9EURO|nr:FAD/NAD(P)-binding domain-containing protein [Aspergillus heteromorphus CBS 117.55]PWY75490.1 FAD/NAD(P)-binding domain-containing protein [Aspergillus heteromorphus CBS 117.55]